MEVIEAVAPSRVAMDLHFTKPFAANNKVLFTVAPAAGGSDVSWSMTGKSPFIHKLFGLFYDMDTMVGGEFAKGLSDLKGKAEQQ